MQTQATAVSPTDGRARTGVNLLGLPPGVPVFDRFTSDGQHVSLVQLEPGEILVNAEAARLLGVASGEKLDLTFADGRMADWRVRFVVNDAGLAGANAAIIAPLESVQFMLSRPGQINQILFANTGRSGDAARSRAVSRRAT